MEAIFKLMQEQQSKFQINSMDDLQEQMQLYGVWVYIGSDISPPILNYDTMVRFIVNPLEVL